MFLIERKWYAVFFWDKETFIEEFIERDLFHATELRQIRWSFLGNKPTKTQIGDMLASPEGREALKLISAQKATALLKNSNLQLASSDQIAQAFIDYFNIESNFLKVFK